MCKVCNNEKACSLCGRTTTLWWTCQGTCGRTFCFYCSSKVSPDSSYNRRVFWRYRKCQLCRAEEVLTDVQGL